MSFGITPLDFGINAHTLIHNAEFAAQASPTIFDIDPDTGSEGKITTVTWNGTSYIPKFADGSQGNAGQLCFYNAPIAEMVRKEMRGSFGTLQHPQCVCHHYRQPGGR